MKAFVLFVCCLIGTSCLKAQTYSYHPFNMDSAVWYIQTIHQNIGSFPPIPTYSYERYFFDGDTIINGTYYTKLYVDFTNNPSAPDGLALSGAVRQDTILRKLTNLIGEIIPPNNDTIYSESIIYNYNWQLGDTIVENNYPAIITSIDSTFLFGKHRKTFTYTYNNGLNINYIYDGLGFNYGFRDPIYYEEHGFYKHLFCYSDHAPNHVIDSCQDVVYTSINAFEKNSAFVLMKSNIIDTEIQLNIDNKLLKSAEIIDIQGKINRYDTSQNMINTSYWASGIYILRVLTTDETYLQQKFLITH